MDLEEYAISNHRQVVPGRTRCEGADEFRASDDEDDSVLQIGERLVLNCNNARLRCVGDQTTHGCVAARDAFRDLAMRPCEVKMGADKQLRCLVRSLYGNLGRKTRSFDCTDADSFGYQELAGVRVKVSEDFVLPLQSPTILIVASIASEPPRFLTKWFLSRRSRSKAQLWQTCPLMHMVNVEFSPIVRVLQTLPCAFAAMLRGCAC